MEERINQFAWFLRNSTFGKFGKETPMESYIRVRQLACGNFEIVGFAAAKWNGEAPFSKAGEIVNKDDLMAFVRDNPKMTLTVFSPQSEEKAKADAFRTILVAFIGQCTSEGDERTATIVGEMVMCSDHALAGLYDLLTTNDR